MSPPRGLTEAARTRERHATLFFPYPQYNGIYGTFNAYCHLSPLRPVACPHLHRGLDLLNLKIFLLWCLCKGLRNPLGTSFPLSLREFLWSLWRLQMEIFQPSYCYCIKSNFVQTYYHLTSSYAICGCHRSFCCGHVVSCCKMSHMPNTFNMKFATCIWKYHLYRVVVFGKQRPRPCRIQCPTFRFCRNRFCKPGHSGLGHLDYLVDRSPNGFWLRQTRRVQIPTRRSFRSPSRSVLSSNASLSNASHSTTKWSVIHAHTEDISPDFEIQLPVKSKCQNSYLSPLSLAPKLD